MNGDDLVVTLALVAHMHYNDYQPILCFIFYFGKHNLLEN